METILSYSPGLIILLLGSFLLLAAIIGGGLEIKEIKIPKIEKTPRILTALMGIMLMACGGLVGVVSFISQTPSQTPLAPTAIYGNYAPNTEYIVINKVQLPQEADVPDDVKEAAATLIVSADKAEILANYYQDASYLNSYYAGYALQQMQQNIENIKQSGYIELDDLNVESSYYVNMNFSNNVLTIDECEYWKTYFYDPTTGNLVYESEWTLVPQTINIELVGDQPYITSISFYQNQAFCTR